MAKKTIKMNEAYQNLQTTQVTNPVGYLICQKKMLDYVKRKGFNPNLSGDGVIGRGLYFIESNLYPNLEAPQFCKYGDSAIKVRANGTFNAYQNRYFGENVFLVPPEQFDSIEILDMIEPGKIQQQKDDMYANYGNRSIGGGAKDTDDFYDLNIPGSLSMQAMEEPDDYVGSLYRDNGRDSRWASPKGDFSTKRISESQLRKMVAMSVKKALNEVYSLALTDDPFMSNLAEYASKEVLSYTEKWMKQDTRQFQDMSFTAERVYGMLNALAKRIVEAATDLHNGSGNVVSPLKESGDTRRGSYMKGRTIGRRLAKGDASTVKKDNLGKFSEMGELGMKDQYDYENAVKNGGIFGNPFKADEKLQDIQDRYDRLKHDDKFFGDWDKAINSNEQSI